MIVPTALKLVENDCFESATNLMKFLKNMISSKKKSKIEIFEKIPDFDKSCRNEFLIFPLVFGAKDIYSSWRNPKSTFGQHLGNICCLKIVLKFCGKIDFCSFFNIRTSKAIFRQHLGNKCCLNVEQMWIFEFFIKSRYFLTIWSYQQL